MTFSPGSPVRVERRDGVALVLIDNPPVNATSQAVRADMGRFGQKTGAGWYRYEINESAKILSEGIVARALDIDMAMIHGYGYPAWRGGPMFEADEIGLPAMLEDVEALHAACGRGWEPAPLLVERARNGGMFGQR